MIDLICLLVMVILQQLDSCHVISAEWLNLEHYVKTRTMHKEHTASW